MVWPAQISCSKSLGSSLCLPIAIFGLFLLGPVNLQANTYAITAEDIIEEVLASSQEIISLRHNLQSKVDLTEAEKKFYYPTVDLIAEYKDNYGEPAPPVEEDAELTVSLSSTLYSSIASARVSLADNNRLVALYSLREKENEFYFEVMEQLINVERSREFLKQSAVIKEKMNEYIVRIGGAVEAGISPRSFLREAELIRVRFNDTVETVKFDIDSYFTQMSLIIGYEIENREDVGIDAKILLSILNQKTIFSPEMAIEKNLRLLSRRHEVESLKHTAETQFERTKFTIFNDTIVGMMDLPNSESGDVRDSSSVGLRVEYKLYDKRRKQTRSSSYNTYLSERELLQNEVLIMRSRVNELNETYSISTNRRENLKQQIELSLELLETQEREILVDKIFFIDMARSLAQLIQTYVSLLENDIQLFRTIISYKSIIDERF